MKTLGMKPKIKGSQNRGATAEEAGFSLVSILLILGVLLMAVMIIAQARVNHQTSQKAIKLKQAYTDVNQALITDIVSSIHSHISASAPCLNLGSLTANFNAGKSIVPSAPSYAYTTSIPGNSGTWPALQQSAAGRCRVPRVPSSGTTSTDNRLYFCIQLGQDSSAPKDSIMNASLAFAEVAAELIDLQTQQPISCTQYFTKKSDPKDGSAGMAITMALYWQSQVASRMSYSQKALSYIANQN